MIFRYPNNITFTEMAKWVDSNSYTPDKDNDKLIEYLYHIIYIKAKSCGYFNDHDTCDDFSLYCISKFLIRFSNKTEPPIKSVVNYLKTVLKPWYAEYVREFCSGSADICIDEFDISDFSDYLIDSASEYDYISYGYLDTSISNIVRKYLTRIPIKRKSAEWSNICTSCLLTLIDRIKCAANLCSKQLAEKDSPLVNRIIRGLKTKPPILFHIEEEQGAYVCVLVNEIVHAIAVELTQSVHSKVSVTTCLQNLVKAASNMEDE